VSTADIELISLLLLHGHITESFQVTQLILAYKNSMLEGENHESITSYPDYFYPAVCENCGSLVSSTASGLLRHCHKCRETSYYARRLPEFSARIYAIKQKLGCNYAAVEAIFLTTYSRYIQCNQ